MATGEETGWLARFESLGDFGDKWQERSSQRQEKAKVKAEKKAPLKQNQRMLKKKQNLSRQEKESESDEKIQRPENGTSPSDLGWS